MKFIWETGDIYAGRKYSKPNILENWMIGYMSAGKGQQYVSVSMSDGLVTAPSSKERLAEILNYEGYIPLEFIIR